MSSPVTRKHDVGAYYDKIPYENYIHRTTHPTHIGAIAALFGLNPPDCRTARVLEIGCATGGNLIAQARMYPQAHFLGIDISKKQILQAEQQKETFKLDNIEFKQRDLLSFDTSAYKEKFDYIIAHGVYSWVPEAVRKQILRICNECLSPHGLAVISYNTLPGWNAVRSLREMILHYTAPFSSPAEKAQQGRFLIDFIGELIPRKNLAHRAVFDEFRAIIQQGGDAYVSHEYLEDSNEPFYFHTFMDQAHKFGLDYVGDSDFGMMYYAALHPDVVKLLKEFKGEPLDTLEHEQYMDFVTNRRFRTTILCKSEKKMNRELKNECIMDYSLSFAPGFTASGSDPREKTAFNSQTGGFATEDEISGALFLELLSWGKVPVPATVLVERVQKKLGLPEPDLVRNTLIEKGLNLIQRNFIQIYSYLPPYTTEVREKPIALPTARLQAAQGSMIAVTNALADIIQNKGIDKQVLSCLDGSKTFENIVDVIAGKDPSEPREKVSAAVGDSLQKMAKQGLLIDGLATP